MSRFSTILLNMLPISLDYLDVFFVLFFVFFQRRKDVTIPITDYLKRLYFAKSETIMDYNNLATRGQCCRKVCFQELLCLE